MMNLNQPIISTTNQESVEFAKIAIGNYEKVCQLVQIMDPKMQIIFEKISKKIPELGEFRQTLNLNGTKTHLLEKIISHYDKITGIQTLTLEIDYLEEEINSVKKTIENIKNTASLSNELLSSNELSNEYNEGTVEINKNIIEIVNNSMSVYLNFCSNNLPKLRNSLTEFYNQSISIINSVTKEIKTINTNRKNDLENQRSETLNNSNSIHNIPSQPINLSSDKEKNCPIFAGTLLGGKAITEGKGKFCIMGTGPGLSWNRGKEIEFDQNTGHWVLALNQSGQEFQYKFAVVFPESIHWEGCEDRIWDPNKDKVEEIPEFEFPKSFPNQSENPSKLG